MRLYSSFSKNFTDFKPNLETISKKQKKEIKYIIASVKDTELFKKTFTHKSCSNIPGSSYETLEFLGDSILSYYVAKFLFTVYPNYDEGDMSKLRSLIVGSKNLANLSLEIGLNNYLMVNDNLPQETRENLIKKEKILADIFESFIATLYIEKGEEILVKFLLLTVFNNSKTKDKIEEFSKQIFNSNSRVAIPSSPPPSRADEGKKHELFEESRDIVIPLSEKSMNQITFKFEKIKPNEKNIESLLDKNNQTILKELVELKRKYDNIIYNLNLQNKNDINLNILNFKSSVEKEFKLADFNKNTLFKQIEKINSTPVPAGQSMRTSQVQEQASAFEQMHNTRQAR